MDQEQIPASALQTSQIQEESLLRVQDIGDLEIARNLQLVEALPDCYLAGMDMAHKIGWMFLPSSVFLYRHNDVCFQKYYINYLDLSRHSQISRTRPTFFLAAGQYHAVFTNGTELIATSVFSSATTKARHRFEQFGEGERILQFSLSVRDPLGLEYFALCTSCKSLYVVCLSGGGNGSVRFEARRLEDPGSRGLVPAVKGLLSVFLPKEKEAPTRMSKLVFKERDANHFSLTVFTSTDIEQQPVRTDLFTLLICRESLRAVKRLSFHPTQRMRHVLDVEVDLNYHYFLGESADRQVFILVSKHDGRAESQVQDLAVLDRDDAADVRAYGRIFKCGPDLWVVLRLGDRHRVLRGSEESLAEFKSERTSHPVIGATVDPQLNLLLFTNHDILKSEPAAGRRGSRQNPLLMDEERPFRETSFVLQIDSRQLEDLLKNGFNQYYVERTTGFIQEGLRINPSSIGASTLGEIVTRNVRVFSEEVSPNLTLYELVNASAPLDNAGKDLVVFDLEQRLHKIAKFREFLQKNRLFEQLAAHEALFFLQAEEALTALVAVRCAELELHRAEHRRLAQLFLEAFKAAAGHARGPGNETLRFYSKPLACWRALEHLAAGTSAAGPAMQAVLAALLVELLQKLESVRNRWAACEPVFEAEALSADWWIHKDSLFLVALPDFFKQLPADLHCLEALAVALIREVERIARKAEDPASHLAFLKTLYGWLLANDRQSVAYQEASAAKNEHMMAEIVIRHNLDLTLMNLTDKLAQASDSLLARMVDVAVLQIQSQEPDSSCTNALRLFSIEQIAPRVRLHVEAFHPSLLWLLLLAQKGKSKEATRCMDTINELDFLQLGFASLLDPLHSSGAQVSQEDLDWSYMNGQFAQKGLRCPKDKVELVFDSPDLTEDRKLVQALRLGALFSESAQARLKLEALGHHARQAHQWLSTPEYNRLVANFKDRRVRQSPLEHLFKLVIDKHPD